MRFSPFWAYTLARIALLCVVGAVLWMFGFRSWALAFTALLLSLPLSLALLRTQRRAFADDLSRRLRARRELRGKIRDGDPPQ